MALTKIKTQSINDNSITNAKMADDAIDSADLADGSIDNVHLAGSIAVSKTLLSAGTGLTLSTNTLSVDAAQTQITSVGTLTSFASTGIDDNATTNAITIDSSEQTIFTRAGASDDNKATVKIEPTGSYGMGLHVYSNADNDANALVQIHSDNASMNMPALRVIQDGTGDAAWLNGGNVSIGNNSPTTKLHITADSTEEDVILLEDNSGTDIGAIRIHGGAFMMKGKSSTAPIQLQTHDGNEDIEVDPDGFIKFETAGSERMRILSSGHIGFGTNDPFTAGWTGERAFEFKGDNTHINLRGNQSGTTAVYAGIWFNDDDNITIGDDPRGVGLRATHDGSADSAKFTILTRKTGTGGATEALTIDSNQNSTFAGDVDINGGILKLSSSAQTDIYLTATTGTSRTWRILTDNNHGLDFYNDTGSAYALRFDTSNNATFSENVTFDENINKKGLIVQQNSGNKSGAVWSTYTANKWIKFQIHFTATTGGTIVSSFAKFDLSADYPSDGNYRTSGELFCSWGHNNSDIYDFKTMWSGVANSSAPTVTLDAESVSGGNSSSLTIKVLFTHGINGGAWLNRVGGYTIPSHVTVTTG